jgi:hypothetical protein
VFKFFVFDGRTDSTAGKMNGTIFGTLVWKENMEGVTMEGVTMEGVTNKK